MGDLEELLFFDTFAHENSEELNLDLVQFPKPVYVTEVRIIPLGARVQADFPGGVRLGATNPSQFQIEFFVNDLGKPGASTFETLGGFEYNQNGCINLVCTPDDTVRKIPTDGLVLRGWYTTITLAVYGQLTANITEQIIPAVVTPSLPAQPGAISDVQQIISQNPLKSDWQEPIQAVPIEYAQQAATPYPQQYVQPETYPPEYSDYYEVPKDPRSYHHTPETDWENKSRGRSIERDRERVREPGNYQAASTQGLLKEIKKSDDIGERRERDRRYSRSHSRDRSSRDFRETSRDKDHDRDWDHDYRDHDKDWDRDRDRDRDRYKHSDNYSRRYSDREERKRPRTPPMHSPKRPHTPHSEHKEPSPKEVECVNEDEIEKQKLESAKTKEAEKLPAPEENMSMDLEEFEPILSDEDLDDTETFQEGDYDYSGYTNNDDLIKLFIPGSTPLVKYQREPSYKVVDNRLVVDEHLKTIIGIADDFFKSSITKYTLKEFDLLNAEIKEEFIHLSEKVVQIVEDVSDFCVIAEIYETVKVASNDEVMAQVEYIVETLVNWLTIALDYDMANAQEQPPYKIRHIKCGVKLAEWCSRSVHFVRKLWSNDFYIHETLLSLYDREYMALSIKLMILKALDTYLMQKPMIEAFVLGCRSDSKENGFHNLAPYSERTGYKQLVEMVNKNPSVRLKFALNSIIKKLNLFEALHKMRLTVVKVCNDINYSFTSDEMNYLTKTLEYLLHVCQSGPFIFSQPKRFLPVAAQFEIGRGKSGNVIIEMFGVQNVIEMFLVLLSTPATMTSPGIKTPLYEILTELSGSCEGLRYLMDNVDTVNYLMKVLLHNEEDTFPIDSPDIKSHNLGLNIAYKLQCLYHIDCLLDIGKKVNYDFDVTEVVDQLHQLFCLTFPNTGKLCCAEVLGMNDNIKCLLQFLQFTNLKSESMQNKLRKSPGVAYIVDLIAMPIILASNILLLETYSKQLLEITSQQDLFEPSVGMKLAEIAPYLRPFENYSNGYDVATLVEMISKGSASVTSYSEVALTCLRILQHIGISKHCNRADVLVDNPLNNFTELKYKHVILQLFPLDGVGLMSKILQDLCDFYEQPNLHTATFVSNQGILIINTVAPCVSLLRQMLTYVIQCRNTQFKDLTTIPVLLQTYNLCQSFPVNSLGYFKAGKVCKEIVDTLLVYTQPVSEEIHEKDSLNKTLWTLMCGEIIKYTILAPHTFMAGLSVFSEILPLPLPIQTRTQLSDVEISWAVNLRKLWSAHLHSHSGNIQDMISKLCTTTYQPLLNLLRKVCAQISDLAANSAVMIARGVLDNVHSAIVIGDDIKKLVCNGHIARLMNFFACLVTHCSLKCAFLYLLSNTSGGKGDEKYPAIIHAFAQILRSTSNVNSHVQTQECILSIFQSFCDTEITLYQNSPNITGDVYLANALPSKDLLLIFLNTMLDHITPESSFMTYLPLIRTLILLTEHDYGFFHLKETLLRRSNSLNIIFSKLEQNVTKDNTDCLTTLNTLIEFLRVCTVPEEVDADLPFQSRKMKMDIFEIQTLIGWKSKDAGENVFTKIEEKLKNILKEDSSCENLLGGLEALINHVRSDPASEPKEMYSEPVLPQSESLLVQFSGRPIFSSNDIVNERLTTSYWLTSVGDENEGDVENVTCDLSEICRQDLSPDISLIKHVEKLCRICPLESTEQVEKEKRLSSQKDKMRRPFITPVRGRGFARPIQIRSDLFRSRPPNTSRPPSLHVDDFVALETCGAQPTGPTGYNKISRELLATSRASRGTRGRAFVASERAMQYRHMAWWNTGPGRSSY